MVRDPYRDGGYSGGPETPVGLTIDPGDRPYRASARGRPAPRAEATPQADAHGAGGSESARGGGFGLGKPVLVLAVMALSAGGLWFAYTKTGGVPGNPGEAPLIRADQSAVKVKPDNPAGDESGEGDQPVAYDPKAIARNQVEELLPPPETPLPKPRPETPAAPVAAPAPSSIVAAASPPVASAAPPAAASPPASRPGSDEASAEAAADAEDEQASTDAAPSAAAAQPAEKPTPTPTPTVAPAAVQHVQIAATPTKETAESEWKRLRHQHLDLLGSLQPSIVRTQTPLRVVYRVLVGPLDGRPAALKLCQSLRQQGAGCMLLKP